MNFPLTKVLVFIGFLCSMHTGTVMAKPASKPKLVVGIVIDQMRYDYLYRFAGKYGNKGFNRIRTLGYSYAQAHYNYVPTYTGPGHASIYSGTTPAYHGIVANDWYDDATATEVYCVGDTTVATIGAVSQAGRMSPKNLLATNLADEMKLATNGKAKVVALSLKDRSSILPAGHHQTSEAYWFDGASGNMVTSNYYMNELPLWMKKFNAQQLPAAYLKLDWETYLPIASYTESTPDSVAWEGIYTKGSAPVFPYHLADINAVWQKQGKAAFDLLRATPFGNSLITEAAMSAVKGASMGKDSVPDLLCISYSSTDYIGHQFGPNAVETEDAYIRMDRELERLMTFLDNQVGTANYVLFLTADHGAGHNPVFLQSQHIPAGSLDESKLKKDAQDFLQKQMGEGRWIQSLTNNQFYLNKKLIQEKGLDLAGVQQVLANWLQQQPAIARAYTASRLQTESYTQIPGSLVQLGYMAKRSGDVCYVLQPGWMEGHSKGTTHGESYNYDTHVPLLWYGGNVKAGESAEKVDITDIATTIAYLLHIQEPNSAIGKVLHLE